MQKDAVKNRVQVSPDFQTGIFLEALEPAEGIIEQACAIGTEYLGNFVCFFEREAIEGGFEEAILQEQPVLDMPYQLSGKL